MDSSHLVLGLTGGLILSRMAAELGLSGLNQRQVRAHAERVPAAFQGFVDPTTYDQSVAYTLAKGRWAQISEVSQGVLLIGVVCSGVLPYAYALLSRHLGITAGAEAASLMVIGLTLSLPALPLDWYAQFRLEERFGFNTTRPNTWWIDRIKGLLLAMGLGYPLLMLILRSVEWAGPGWWLGAWSVLLVFQVLILILAPLLILPLFNRFSPLSAGSLRDRLLALARRTQFRASQIQVMDGSKRSRHSNAFFTGFGRFRKIVLFDTLLEQLTEPELEAVLAHEIGHYKKKHLVQHLAFSAFSSLAGFYLIARLARQPDFYRAFGFEFAPTHPAPALLLFGLLSGTVLFWFSPLTHAWSRRHEYQADAFAAQVMNGPGPLLGALRKLSEKNLSNLTPHPLYSWFYYSHPSLLERAAALNALAGTAAR